MPLCNRCLALDIETISRTIPAFTHSPSYDSSPDIYIYKSFQTEEKDLWPYHDSIESLSINANSCDLCRLLQHQASTEYLKSMTEEAKKWYTHSPRHDQRLWVCGLPGRQGFIVLLRDEFRDLGSMFKELGHHFANSSQISDFGDLSRELTDFGHDGSDKDLHSYLLVGAFAICAEQESAMESVVPTRRIPSSPAGHQVLDQIRGWMTTCLEEQPDINQRSISLPTRILSIQDGAGTVVLRHTSSLKGKYAALSHCWGSNPPIWQRLVEGLRGIGFSQPVRVLTSKSMTRLAKGVKTSALPQSFQDAIWLTHQLGLRYLWIDSLCIIQDDGADWAKESANMCDVYGNATITIAASRAANSSEGFLKKRQDITHVILPFRSHDKCHCDDVVAFPLSLKLASNYEDCIYMRDEPLSRRGWAFQERYLSPRTVHFGSSQIFFESDQGFVGEDGWELPGWKLPFRLGTAGTLKDRYEDWAQLVVSYTERKLTIPDDKLPAFAGLGRYFQTSLGNSDEDPVSAQFVHYLAGLWSDNLIPGLCWGRDVEGPPLVPSKDYRAPSWSWASVDGPIEWKLSPNRIDAFSELAVVQDFHIDHKDPDLPFGRVTGGWLRLRAITLPIYESQYDPLLRCHYNDVRFDIIVEWDTEPWHTILNRNSATSATRLISIPLAWEDTAEGLGTGGFPVFLVLKQVEHTIQHYADLVGYRRVGHGYPIVKKDELTNADGHFILDMWKERRAQGNLDDILLL